MGLLDDAIREHLDLKRRRGADPAEIERAEREALGPVRREPIGPEDSAGTVLGTAEHEAEAPEAERLVPAPGIEAEPEAEDLYAEEDVLAEDEEWDDYDDGYEGEDEEEFEPHLPSSGAAVPPATAPPVSEPLEPLPPDPDESLGDTVSYDLPEAPAREGDPDQDDDMLEETPEFLQDTPDHDRLWFEQRPPRDFDFDE